MPNTVKTMTKAQRKAWDDLQSARKWMDHAHKHGADHWEIEELKMTVARAHLHWLAAMQTRA